MNSWCHFLADTGVVNTAKDSDSRNCFRSKDDSSALQVPASSTSEFNQSIDSAILRSLSSSPLQGMSQNRSSSIVPCVSAEACLEESFNASESQPIPRRNLTEAFEELYIEPSTEAETPLPKQGNSNERKDNLSSMISPTGVTELPTSLPPSSEDLLSPSNPITLTKDGGNLSIGHFELHADLKRDLSQALVDRTSFYAVIHDINKEATAMAANDESEYSRHPQDQHEEYDPLVVAVNGCPEKPFYSSSRLFKVALIDEESWLLDAIDARRSGDERSVKACPPTFLEAIGEKDYENPLTSLSTGSRTQLWKPSRSWWEAKSGKNPWIEPKSHNKRWRYLWPLIHYHKFIARCIKKLKRNGIDVKSSVSPVAVFLREEVCAISDHLAAVSLFDSDQWMGCLKFFDGWTDPDQKTEERIRRLISKLKLRPLSEPGDVDSPLLRSQIDAQYLKAMASARAQMSGTTVDHEKHSSRDVSNRQTNTASDSKSKRSSFRTPVSHVDGHPPPYPKQQASPSVVRANAHLAASSPAALHRQRWSYPPQYGQWWGSSWNPQAQYPPYGDDASVHSALSGDSYSQHYDPNAYTAAAMHHAHFYPMMYPHHQMPAGPPGVYNPVPMDPPYPHDAYSTEQVNGWMGHPQGGTVTSQQTEHGSLDQGTAENQMAASPSPPIDGQQPPSAADQTPYKYNPNQVAMSPYWGHLDQATLAMMGIATPQGSSSPQTPSRGARNESKEVLETPSKFENNSAMNAQPPLIRQHYYGYGQPYTGAEGFGPLSPATQFMMSPQASFAHNYGYGVSPHRPQGKRYSRTAAAEKNDERNDVSEGEKRIPPPAKTQTSSSTKNRESPGAPESKADT